VKGKRLKANGIHRAGGEGPRQRIRKVRANSIRRKTGCFRHNLPKGETDPNEERARLARGTNNGINYSQETKETADIAPRTRIQETERHRTTAGPKYAKISNTDHTLKKHQHRNWVPSSKAMDPTKTLYEPNK